MFYAGSGWRIYRINTFAEDRIEVLHQFIREQPLAMVITSGSKGIIASLIPISLHALGKKGTLRFHLAKMNPQAERLRKGDDVLIIFQGPQGYVTPNFYPTKKNHGRVVPTRNYSMVQVSGKLTVVDDPKWLLQQISDLTETMESTMPTPWKVSDAPEDYILGQLKIIIGIEILIEKIEGKFKASQNQSEENRLGVTEGFFKNRNFEMAVMVAHCGFGKVEKK